MSKMSVKIGFVPSYRFGFTEWCGRMHEASIKALQKVEGLELVKLEPSPDEETLDPERGLTPHGAVQTLDQAEAAAGYFERQGVDGLVVCPLDFGDERSAAKVAERLELPVLLYATREPPPRTDAGLGRVSDSYCGNLAVAAALYRRSIPFRWAGLFMPDQPGLQEELTAFVQAVSVRKGLVGARIGQVGLRPEPFESCEFSERELIRKFRQVLIPSELTPIIAAAEKMRRDGSRLDEAVEQIRESVATVHVSEEHLRRAASLELALMDFWEKNSLSAMAMQCWPTIGRSMEISACGVFGRLVERGMLVACEADVLGALTMLVNYRAALGRRAPHFIDWTIQHREDPDKLLAWHCGNAPPCLAAHPDRAALRSRRDMKGEKPIGHHSQEGLYQFELEPGRVTLCRLAEYGGQWKMLIAGGQIVPTGGRQAGTWSWVRVNDHEKLYRTLVEEGFIHHASMIHGNQRPALERACEFLDIEPVIVE